MKLPMSMMLMLLLFWLTQIVALTYRAAAIEFAGKSSYSTSIEIDHSLRISIHYIYFFIGRYTPNRLQPRLTRALALAEMRANLVEINALVAQAAAGGAQVVVVPEDSLYGFVIAIVFNNFSFKKKYIGGLILLFLFCWRLLKRNKNNAFFFT